MYFGTCLKNLTKPQVERFRNLCNFTEEEDVYFSAKVKGKSNINVAAEHYWSMSKVTSVARHVRAKMEQIATKSE